MKYWLILSITLFSLSAMAQEDEVIPDSEDPSVVYKKNTEIDFEDDVVEGSFVRPEGEFMSSRKGGRNTSLIRIRENFLPEMLKSAEDI
ncbi:hypothetical protein KKF91_16490 [Myxococcota bacterium]|nr:hypothetical protein [Myxococcota bacterium]MBU1432135.1 hypothetical protein [Myxococcota bacterium]MBU1898634.1 hypothetical protein [Myxococcota bacterium]